MDEIFRIAFGDCSAKSASRLPPGAARQLGEAVNSRIDRLKALSREQLVGLADTDSEIDWCSGNRIVIDTYHLQPETDQHLFVVQAFRRTLKSPNWISLRGFFQLAVEGVLLLPDGTIADAPDELLWPFR